MIRSNKIARDDNVIADRQFCGAHYQFDPVTLGFDAVKKGWIRWM